MNKNHFKNRWSLSQVQEVVDRLESGRSFEGLDFVGMHDGRWDLRGIWFPGLKKKKWRISGKFSATVAIGQTEFKKIKIKNIDLSFSDISSSIWQRWNKHARHNYWGQVELLGTFLSYKFIIRLQICNLKKLNIPKIEIIKNEFIAQ